MKPDVKVALIALIITIGLQYLLFNTASLNLLIAGIYLGISKDYTAVTKKTYYLLAVLFYIFNYLLVKGGITSVDPGKALFVAVFSALLVSLVPLFIAWVTRKIRKV